MRETLAELNSIQTTTDADRLASGVLRESLEIGVIQFDAGEHLRNIRTVRSDVDLARMIFDNMPTANADDWSVTAERMSKVPQAFAGMCESWRLGMQRDYSDYLIVDPLPLAVEPILSISIPILVFNVHGLPANLHSQCEGREFDPRLPNALVFRRS